MAILMARDGQKTSIPSSDLQQPAKGREKLSRAQNSETGLTTSDGRQAKLQTADELVFDGGKQRLNPVVEIVPVISADKTAVELSLKAQIDRRSGTH